MDTRQRIDIYTKQNRTRYQVTDRQARRLRKKARRDSLAWVNSVPPETLVGGQEFNEEELPNALMVHFSGIDFIPHERPR